MCDVHITMSSMPKFRISGKRYSEWNVLDLLFQQFEVANSDTLCDNKDYLTGDHSPDLTARNTDDEVDFPICTSSAVFYFLNLLWT